MRWEVIVNDFSGDFRLLSDVLVRWDMELLRNDDAEWVLRSEKFETCGSHGEVWKIVRHIQETIEILSNLNDDIDLGLELDTVVEHKDDGNKSKHVYLQIKAAAMSIVGHPAVIKVSPRSDMSEEERKEWAQKQAEKQYQKQLDETIVRVIPALDNYNVITVMKMLNSDLNPTLMGNIVNLIKDDMGGNVSDLVSKSQLTRFDRSINHPEVYAERARHIVSKQDPPPVPMHQEEAEAFVKSMVKEWLHYKYENRNR